MLSFVVWWATADLLAFATFPLAFRLLHCLPDRGYAAAKPLGIILSAFIFWFGASLGIVGNDRGSVLLVLVLVLFVGALLGGSQRRPLTGFVEANLHYIFAVEAIFLAIFAWFALLRSYAPDILATEKQFELAFLNGVGRTPFFPPPDPWLSGHVMNYYYFGWVNVAFLDKLTQTSSAVGFNLGTPLTAALAAVTIFGLVFGLVRRSPLSGGYRRALAFGLLGVVLLLFLSNLEGVLELMATHGLGSAGFYNAVGVGGLTAGKTSSHWYPTEFWFWWRATRMGSGYNIMEFPYFSFMLGDLHPHVMVLPFALLALTFIWNLMDGEQALDGHWWRRNPLHLLVLGVLLGALGLLNAWDQPAAFLILVLAALIANHRRTRTLSWGILHDSLLFAVPLVLLSFLLYVPYWGVFEKTDIIGFSAVVVSVIGPGEARDSMATPPLHLLLFWGPLFWLLLSFLAAHMRRTRAFLLAPPYVLLPLACALLPVFVWLLAVGSHLGPAGLAKELGLRGSGLLTEGILLVLLVLDLAALMREAIPTAGHKPESGVVFALICGAIGLLWILGAELFWVVESSNGLRYNTVFKLWYQAWMLEGVATAIGTAYLMRGWRPQAMLRRPARLAWTAGTALLLACGLVYPLIATPNRTEGFSGHPTLDGLAFFQRSHPDDYAAAVWLSANVAGTPIELEAEGGELAGNFSPEGGRISELTGLPTVLAWLEHDQVHHGILAPLQQRSADIRTIYTTSDAVIARGLLQRYGVHYVVVGDLERRVYGPAGMQKFAGMGTTVYRASTITIYDVTQPPPLPVAP
jgi:YYY domain-containing protein